MVDNLRYKSIFDIIGPVMIGPSSSHTAGAARIGKIIASIFGEQPDEIEIHLYESFAKTYRGHGTDVAIVAGVLGMEPDDPDLSRAPEIAHERGMTVSYVPHLDEQADHPNTARLICKKGEKLLTVTGISLGGGLIQVTEINNFEVSLSMGKPTFVLVEQNTPTVFPKLTALLEKHDVSIAQMTLTGEIKEGRVLRLLEVDGISDMEEIAAEMREIPELYDVNFFR